MQFFLFFVTIIGHVFLWVGILNRLHARNISRRLLHAMLLIGLAFTSFVPIVVGWWWFNGGKNILGQIDRQLIVRSGWFPFFLYVVICWLAAASTLVRWIFYRFLRRPPELLRFYRQRRMTVAPPKAALTTEEHTHHIAVHLPGNEVLQLELTEWAIEVPRLPRALDGLTIVHISDFHFNGAMGKAYFREVVRVSNELKPDLVAITGDILDKAEYMSWIPDILGQLTGRYGIYTVLGNHDCHLDKVKIRRTLADSGLTDLSGRWIRIEIRGEAIIMAGNGLPWFSPAADLKNCPSRSPDRGQLRIALSHSPDQLGWARSNDVDLMLSGHTHGGQIRIPLIGPIFSPSSSGVKYNHGLFHVPPTVLHVTRGVSGEHPLRWNCPPEIALLTLHAPPT